MFIFDIANCTVYLVVFDYVGMIESIVTGN